MPTLGEIRTSFLHIVQERFSLKEKSRRKRRAFVQALHAA